MPRSNQKGVIPLIVIFIALVVIGGGIVGVQSGLLKLTAAPSKPGSPIGPYDREPAKNTPTPTPEDKTDLSQDIPKPSFTPHIAQKNEGKLQTYTSSQYGYSVTYPQDWELFDGNTKSTRQIQIRDKANLGYVNIQAFFDKSLSEAGNIQKALDELEKKFRSDPRLKVEKFKSQLEGKVGGYIGQGTETVDNQDYYFENRGLLATNGKILLFFGNYKKSAPTDYLQKIEKIFTSFKTD